MSVGTLQREELERAEKLLAGYRSAEPDGVEIPSERSEYDFNVFDYAALTSGERRSAAVFAFFLGVLLLGGLAFFSIILIGLTFLLGASAIWFIQRKVVYRAEQFERDYPALLLSMASSVRTGLDPLVALSNAGELFRTESVMRVELARFKKKIEGGASEEDAIRTFAITVQHPDIKLFRTAFMLARREGSSLGSCLQRLTKVTRQRQSFRRKMRAAIAMQKFSSIGIALCTIVIGLMQFFMSPEAFRNALEHPIGSKVLFFGALLMASGLGWMMRLGRSRI